MEGSFKESQPGLQLEIDTTPVPTGQSRDDKLFATLASGTAWDVWQRDIRPAISNRWSIRSPCWPWTSTTPTCPI